MMSTLIIIHLGYIHEGYTINARTDNPKLRTRPRNIVTSVSCCDQSTAERALEYAGNSVEAAVLLAADIADVEAGQGITRRRRAKNVSGADMYKSGR